MGDEPSFEHLIVSSNGQTAQMQLNRPERLNALSAALMQEITEAANWFDQQPDLRVVVVSGAGRSFCAGFDIDAFGGNDQKSSGKEGSKKPADLGRIMADAIENMAPIAIARLHGHVVGGGLVLAAACDLRIASAETSFSIPEVDLGIPLAWGGIPRLVREIGPTLTKELVMTCRPFDAEEASKIGFLNKITTIDEIDSVVNDLVSAIAAKPRIATLSTKSHVNAVTSQMVGTVRSWADADGLEVAMADPESQEAQASYLAQIKKKNSNS
ncbi:MAG: enoyl-CoA hydratase/isomerase family protein [Acidimicrobiales bacterium]|jgi:enoyl-CoA hydratase/carnithine racemase|nr:enoyl-CoA hydratase [Acidimicrobiaceae bacterium]MDP6322898.1 enoyl-CoA hydratase/isomerase family protein [Acidimicrobiales bacterium]MDP6895270.1 enoyl-CoA hydratase/isomerase family protein [Acidimicrobiales bacterium]HJM38250.1 enoyl-CoA hydratase/isomerase family protein [Acidimicrobiales bacterium]|tara:strand:+ start:8308 stop:9117 length:810 start_codon:yes stop_codon:yes gene_type:complete